jgi:hypothetical protein
MDKNEFEKLYPNYCKACKGWGIFKQISPKVNLQDCDCVKNGQCPRCGEANSLSRAGQCSECGFSMDDKERGLPGSVVD